ncbi:hypothetical protein KAK06_15115 [Ideonella sp. 4Y11]|uniref:Uncharacterized protein n=1 Tax=Ideonella aquatica TaxID=2824119 RepID=A0A941BKU8_9BURK|nr:hypothetical protein [Ideonella aquatica]MBQ0960283.1 hypothetical protein [Ideonella aquatica]
MSHEHSAGDPHATPDAAARRFVPTTPYHPRLTGMTACGNGSLDDSLDPTQWQGAVGRRNQIRHEPGNIFAEFEEGLFPGAPGVLDGHPHQAHVTSGTADPLVGISQTAPGSTGAVRLGNSRNWPDAELSCEVLSKTFIVPLDQPFLSFWYAVVQHGGPDNHNGGSQAYFRVRVTDAQGVLIPGAFSFGNGLGALTNSGYPDDTLVANPKHPLFQSAESGTSDPYLYKDWSCAQIDLSTHLGQQVTVEFITADCAHTGHFSYAYIDNICGTCAGSPSGSFRYACEASDHCGAGKICFDYSLPSKVDKQGLSVTGEVSIQLQLIQNGVTVLTLSSGLLIRGERHCFAIDPAQLTGLNPALGGFDIRATASFSMGQVPLGTMVTGTPHEGVTAGRNNDYRLRCPSCDEIARNQAEQLRRRCATKRKHLARVSCHCPPGVASGCGCGGGCSESHGGAAESADLATPALAGVAKAVDCDCQGHCDCKAVTWPSIKPCLSVAWADSDCDGLEGNDVEVMCISVCNCHSNLGFSNLVIQQIQVTDAHGRPVAMLPDGTPSIQVVPSGPLCFGDIGPCRGKDQPSCVTRELAVSLRGAAAGSYRLTFSGICFDVVHHVQDEQCFVLPVCKD